MTLCIYSKGSLLFGRLKVFHLRPSIQKLFFLVYGCAEHLQSIARVFTSLQMHSKALTVSLICNAVELLGFLRLAFFF